MRDWGFADFVNLLMFSFTITLCLIVFCGCETPTAPDFNITINCYTGTLSNDMRTFNPKTFTVVIPYQLGMKVEVYCSPKEQKLWKEPEDWWIHEDGFVLILEGTNSWCGYDYLVTLL